MNALSAKFSTDFPTPILMVSIELTMVVYLIRENHPDVPNLAEARYLSSC